MLRQSLKNGLQVAGRRFMGTSQKAVKPVGVYIRPTDKEVVTKLKAEVEECQLVVEKAKLMRQIKDPLSDAKLDVFKYVAGGTALGLITAAVGLYKDEVAAERKEIAEVISKIERMSVDVNKIISHQKKGKTELADEDHETILKTRNELNELIRLPKYKNDPRIVSLARGVILDITKRYKHDRVSLSQEESAAFCVTPEILARHSGNQQGLFAGTGAQALLLSGNHSGPSDSVICFMARR